jgi:DNA (cytosine-5)-methyltransferase 1
MNVLSLFAGVGGFDLAAQRAGMTVVAHCEIDKAARAVLQRRFPDALTYDDVRTLDPDELRAAGAVPDLICGGFPCQDLSVAGRRAGLAGARSGLFFEIVRLAADLRPRWLVLENVPGLLSSNDGRDMGAVLGALGELGYGWAYRVLDAQHFGVPQRRRRVFIVGCLGDRRAPVAILLEPEGSDGNPAQGEQARSGVAGGTAISVALRGRDGGATAELGDDQAFTLRASQGGGDKPHAIVNSLTSAQGGPDDNDAQAGHLIAYQGQGRAGNGGVTGGVPFVAATLTGGTAAKRGVNAPGRRQEDDYNLVATTLTAREGKGPDSDATTTLIPILEVGGRRGEGDDREGLGIGQDRDPMFTLQAGKQHGIAHTLTGEGHDASEDGTGRGTPLVPMTFRKSARAHGKADVDPSPESWVEDTVCNTLNTFDVGDTRAVDLAVQPLSFMWQAGGNNSASGAHEYDMTPTLPTSQTIAVQTSLAVRRLTPTECERLQGFPDGWTAGGVNGPQADSARYRQMGNAVAVPVVEWILRRLKAVDAAKEKVA